MHQSLSRIAVGISAAAVAAGIFLMPAAAFADEPADSCMALVTANIEQTVSANASGVSTRVKPTRASNSMEVLEEDRHYQVSKPVECNGESWRQILMWGQPIGQYIPADAVTPVDPFAGIKFDSWIALAPGVEWTSIGSEPSSERQIAPIMEAGVFAASRRTIAGEDSMRYSDDGYRAIKLPDGTRGFVEAAKVQSVSKDFKSGAQPKTSDVAHAQATTSTPSESTAPSFLPGLFIGFAAGAIAIAIAIFLRRRKKTTTIASKEPTE